MTVPSPDSLIAARRRDSAQRRQRVLATLDELVADGVSKAAIRQRN